MAGLGLKGTAFITGAGSGIGQFTAYALAHHGVRRLAITDINPSALETTVKELKARHSDIEVQAIEMDCSKEESIEAGIAATVSAFGRIDIAVNNAGTGGETPSADMPASVWHKIIGLNLDGVWMCQRAQIRQMLKQDAPSAREGKGRIVNVASMYGLVGPGPKLYATAYTASKHGVLGLTKADASTYAPLGVRINAICPGYVNTPLLLASAKTQDGMKNERDKVPLGRFADMEEIGDCIAFLASPLASYMSGSALVADGGFSST